MPEKIITLSKILGGVGGSLISLAIIKPATVLDALSRLFSSIILAYYLTTPVITTFSLTQTNEMEMGVAVGIGIFGWFIISIALHTVGGAKSIKDLREKLK